MDISYFSFSATIALLVFFVPCQQPFLGSILLPQTSCQTETVPILARLSLAMFEFAALHYLIITTGVFIACLLFGGMIHLWLESSQLFCNAKFTLKYRELQTFEKLFNACVQGRILPVIVSFSPVLEILGGFACIRLRQGMNSLIFAFIVMETLMVMTFNLVFYSGAGKIYTGSVKWLRNCKMGENRRLNRKMLASFTQLKVRFGQNFVDGLTPLIFQQFCTMQMVNLLLLF